VSVNLGRNIGAVLLGQVKEPRDGRNEIVIAHTLIRRGFGLHLLAGIYLVFAVRLRLPLIVLDNTSVLMRLHTLLLLVTVVVVLV
jgi:hypothetical protein